LARPDLPRVEHGHVRRARSLAGRLLSRYLERFNDRLRPMKPIALANGMPAYDLTQPPLGSEPGLRLLKTGLRYVLLHQEARPITMVLAATSACNMHCVHCSAREYLHSGEKPLEHAEMLDLIDQFLELGGCSVIFSGGEPTLLPRLPEMVSHVSKAKAVVAMFTNGARLSERVSELKDAGLFGTLVSLDADSADAHDRKRRCAGAFDKAVKGVEALMSAGMLAGVSTYISRHGLESGHFERMLALSERLRVHQMFLFDAVPTGAMLHEKAALLGPDGRARVKELVKAQNANPAGPAVMGQSWVNSAEGFGCFAGFYQLYVSPAGEVCPCDFTPVTFGNIRREPLRRIWKRMRASQEWGERHAECRMQDECFRTRFIDVIPDGTALPVPYEAVLEMRRAGLASREGKP
jgi:radical SAM protein with 4Fe4S-binding SPASM domain